MVTHSLISLASMAPLILGPCSQLPIWNCLVMSKASQTRYVWKRTHDLLPINVVPVHCWLANSLNSTSIHPVLQATDQGVILDTTLHSAPYPTTPAHPHSIINPGNFVSKSSLKSVHFSLSPPPSLPALIWTIPPAYRHAYLIQFSLLQCGFHTPASVINSFIHQDVYCRNIYPQCAKHRGYSSKQTKDPYCHGVYILVREMHTKNNM